MQFFILLSLAACALADGVDHHHHQDQYSVPQAADPVPSYGAPQPGAESYGAPQEAPIYSSQEYGAPAPQEYGAPTQQEYAPQEYGAPAQQEYAPAGEYGAPAQPEYAQAGEYGAPTQEYTAQAQQEYAAPTSYETPQQYEAAVLPGTDLFDLSKITELLPLFLSVIGAIIVSQVFAPLIAGLVAPLAPALAALFAPVTGVKKNLINAILSPFNLALCDISGATPVLARSSSEGLQMNPDTVDMVANMLYKALENYSQ